MMEQQRSCLAKALEQKGTNYWPGEAMIEIGGEGTKEVPKVASGCHHSLSGMPSFWVCGMECRSDSMRDMYTHGLAMLRIHLCCSRAQMEDD